MTNIVTQFDTPLGTDNSANTRPATNTDSQVLVEDSVTHQAGEGQTAGLPASMETPDIFDNSPQAVIKTQQTDQSLDDNDAVEDAANKEASVPLEQKVEGQNTLVPTLDTLSDGSVDIPRD